MFKFCTLTRPRQQRERLTGQSLQAQRWLTDRQDGQDWLPPGVTFFHLLRGEGGVKASWPSI